MRRWWLLPLAAAVVLTACGIGPDDAPRDINAPVRQESGNDDRSEITATSTTLIYLVGHADDGRFVLMPIARDVTETITNALQALFAGPTTRETNADLRTAIPSSTRLLKAGTTNDVVSVDVTADLASLSGSALVDAIGQIVLTATNVTGVSGVLVTIGDAPHPWPLPDGSTSAAPLSRRDYESLLPSRASPVTEPSTPVTDPATTTTTTPPAVTVPPVSTEPAVATEPPPT